MSGTSRFCHIVDFEKDPLTVGLERSKVVLFVGVVGMTEVVEHRDGLDDAVDGDLAERRNARRHDGNAAGKALTQFVIEGANARRLDITSK